MSSGYIKLYRKVLFWEWYDDVWTTKLFLHLLITANHTDRNVYGVPCLRGQTITGRKKLARENGMSEQQVRTSLKKLIATKEITSRATNKYTIITVCNYEEYQCKEDEEQPTKRHTSNQVATKYQPLPKKDKKDKKRKEYTPSFDSFWKMYPKKIGKKKAFEAWEKANCENGHLQEVLSGVEAYAIHCQREETEARFILHPTTYINQERWTDEYGTTPEPVETNPFNIPEEYLKQ